MWKRLIRWFRSRVTVDVAIDDATGAATVSLWLRVGRETALVETFEWEVGWSRRLRGGDARRELSLRSLDA